MGRKVKLEMPDEQIDHMGRVLTLWRLGVMDVPFEPGMSEFDAVKIAYDKLMKELPHG